MDIDKLKDDGVMYLIPQINSYTCQKFSEQPNTCFGVMKRTSDDMGEVFEPATVVNRFVLDSECTQASPYVIDIVNREILWMNEQAMREIYIKPFEIAVKEGGTRGIMSSFNRIGRNLCC